MVESLRVILSAPWGGKLLSYVKRVKSLKTPPRAAVIFILGINLKSIIYLNAKFSWRHSKIYKLIDCCSVFTEKIIHIKPY